MRNSTNPPEQDTMVKLMEVVTRGFPQSNYELDDAVIPFHKFIHDHYVADG